MLGWVELRYAEAHPADTLAGTHVVQSQTCMGLAEWTKQVWRAQDARP